MEALSDNSYPLHDAARQANVSRVEELLRVSPREASREDLDGRLPLHWAASVNSLGAVAALAQLPGFDPDAQDASGWTPLMIASSVNDSDKLLLLLLKSGADINQKNANSQTALHLVASKNKLDTARLLVGQQPPASSRIRDKRGQYPIHRAAAAGSSPMIKLLLDYKSSLDATDNDRYTALHHAIAEGHGDAALTLLKAGADYTRRSKEGMLPIDLAPDKEVKRYILQMAEVEGIEI